MPLHKHFGGHGVKVMKDMKARYGEKKGEQVFYSTAAKRGDKHFYGNQTKPKEKTGA